MLLHRAVAFLVAAFFICCSASPSNAATDTQYLYVAHTTASLVQNSGVESVTVYRNGSASGAASVLCKTVNGTAVSGRDFTAVSTTLKWASGDASPKQCSVPISDATPFSGPRTFLVQLSGPTGIALHSAEVTVTVYGNKGGGAVSVAAPTYKVAQNAGKATITVNRTGGSVGSADVYYATANSSAIAGTDYTAESGELSWANGDAAPKSFSIPINNAKPFTGTKTLAIAIARPVNVDLGSTKTAIVTIDGDAAGTTKPTVTISATPTSVESGESPSLTWTATNATTCTASGGWSGLMATSGTMSPGAISESTTYTLSCTGTAGSASQSVTVSMASAAPTSASACPVTSGPLTLKVSAVRTTGISPFLMFFDATGTTDTSIAANTTTFQNVTYTWNFGDTGASGTSTWAYGSNPGKNSKNTATGGIASHLYVTSGNDTAYKATVTATDGTNTATCSVPVTAYNPSGANGFAGTKTTCVAASSTPVAGSGDCPAGAAVLRTSSFTTATGSAYVGAGKRVLFHCGDSFSGGGSMVSGAKWSIGAYGGCEGTQTNRPIVTGGGVNVSMQATGDGRIADLDFESVGSGHSAVLSNNNYDYVTYQLTMYNLLSHGNDTSFYIAQCAQCGYIQLVQTGMGVNQGTFINFAENNQAQWGTNSPYNNIDYQAVLGSSFNGAGAPNSGAGIETVRVSACRMCVIADNTMENANDVGAVLKLHNGNTKDSAPTWSGVYTELIEISDNLFSGTSGAQLVETAPQNAQDDERLRNIVVERNIFQGSDTGGGRQILVSAVNETLRDNVFNQSVSGGGEGIQVAKRGIEPVPQFVEVYNNTCYGGTCAAFSGSNFAAAGINSWAENNLCFTGTCISNGGSGNTVSNNTASTSSNPGFTNGSGSLKLISDFKPTENYTGATTVPVHYDAMGVAWPPTWNLGAVHH